MIAPLGKGQGTEALDNETVARRLEEMADLLEDRPAESPDRTNDERLATARPSR